MKKFYLLLLSIGTGMAAFANPAFPVQENPVKVNFGESRHIYDLLTAPGMKNEGREVARIGGASSQMITTLPETASEEVMVRDGGGYYAVAEQAYVGSMYGLSQKMGFDGDDVYMFRPIFQFSQCNAYVKGIKGEKTWSFAMPQKVYEDNSHNYYAALMRFDKNTQWYTVVPESQNPALLLTLNDEGQYEFDCKGYTTVENTAQGTTQDFPNEIIGLVDDAGYWYGYGDYYYRIYPFKGSLVSAPEGIETQRYTLLYGGAGKYVDVAFDGDDVWFKGFSNYNPESWVKGTMKDNKITIPSKQYMGICSYIGYYTYFYGLNVTYAAGPDGSQQQNVEHLDAATLVYDPETKSMTAECDLCVCGGPKGLAYLDYMPMPSMYIKGETQSLVPAKPEITSWINMTGDMQSGQLLCTIPYISESNDILDANMMSFRLLIDGEPFELDPADYMKLEAPLEWIPYFLNDGWDIMYAGGINHFLYFYVEVPETIGVQSRYVDEDGKEYLSEPCTVDASTGSAVSGVAADKEVESVFYTDLLGRRVANPQGGIFIKTSVYTDGSVDNSKVIIK